MIKIIFLDFDGTVYSHKSGHIPESSIEAINKLHQNGILVFLCTGRSYSEFEQFDLSRIYYDGMITTNGQLSLDRNGNILFDHPIEGILKEKVVRMYEEKKMPISLATKDYLFFNFINQRVVEALSDVSTDIPEIRPYNNENFHLACAFFDNNDDYEKTVDSLKDISEITTWHELAIDIVPLGMNKASGIDRILKIYNLDKTQSMAFGDGNNDMDMLRHCQIGVAMGNSVDTLKEVADYVTDDIDDDGLYNALRYYNLI